MSTTTEYPKTCGNRTCSAPVTRIVTKSHGLGYCDRHMRFLSMRSGAKRHGLDIPTYGELDILHHVWAQKMLCWVCGRQMRWHTEKSGPGRKNALTLQHNHDGTLHLICFACNAGHAQSQLGDAFFRIPRTKKYCPDCKLILEKSEFAVSPTKGSGRATICKICDCSRHRSPGGIT